MSFWQGVARGIEAGEAKREKEAARAERLASESKAESRWQMQWENTLANQQEAREEAEQARILEQERFDLGQLRQREQDDIAAAGRVEEQDRYEAAEARLDEQGRISAENTAYERSYRIIRDARADEYKDREWTLDVDQWDFTKNSAAQAQANADRIFNQQLVRFEREGTQIDEATSRADRAEARAIADDLFQKERLVLTDAVAEQNRKDRMAQFDKTFGLQVQQFELDKEYKDRAWALGLEKWDFTKDQADQAQENSNRIFNQGIAAFERQGDQMTLVNERADRAEARAIADALFAKERLILADNVAEQNRQDRLDQFDKTFGLQKRGQDFREAQVFVDLMPAGLMSAFGGDAVSTTGKKSKAISAAAMESGNPVFNKRLAQLDKNERNSAFFKAASNSPGAQATILAFMEAQANKGNTLQLKDMPKYFEYLGSTAEQGADDAKEFLNNVIGGQGWKDKDSLVNGLIALKNYKPAQALFAQTGAPASLTDTAAQVSLWETAVEVDAYRGLEGLSADRREDAEKALSMLQRKENRVEGLDILASLGFGLTAAKEKNMMDNPVIQGYYNAAENTPTPVDPPVIDPPDLTGNTFTSDQMDSLTAEEYKTIAESNPYLIIDGQRMENPLFKKTGKEVPAEVKQAVVSILETGDQEAIDQANKEVTEEFGAVAAGVLFDDAKSARGTGKSAMMDGLQTPSNSSSDSPETEGYQPPSMGATELNTPAVREALEKVPTEVQEGVKELLSKGTPEEIKEGKAEITKVFGPEVASILFDDLKSERGTGKSAMMSGLQ